MILSRQGRQIQPVLISNLSHFWSLEDSLEKNENSKRITICVISLCSVLFILQYHTHTICLATWTDS